MFEHDVHVTEHHVASGVFESNPPEVNVYRWIGSSHLGPNVPNDETFLM